MSTENTFKNLITSFDPTKKYVLAVSGGSDSMAMLAMFLNFGKGLNFSVVTVNHKMRAEGAADAKFVADFCRQGGVECQIFEVDVLQYSKQNRLSHETAARLLRYEIFDRLSCDFVCLAHNAQDNAETVIMHLARGSGLNGVCGMSQVQGKYFRPLLRFSKTHLQDFCLQNDVPHVVDQTNSDTQYSRNFVRSEILPKLVELNSNAVDNINRFASLAQADEALLKSLADISTVRLEADKAFVPLELFNLPQPLVYRTIQKVFCRLGVHCNIEMVHIDSIVSLKDSYGGKKIHLPFDFVATNDYNGITIFRKGEQQDDSQPFCAKFAIGQHDTPFGKVVVSKQPLPNSLKFDLDKIPDGAVIRTIQAGDTFTKFGGGTKKLNRFLIDKKIPQRQRNNILLVCCDSQVLVVCDVEICDGIKVCASSNVGYITIEK